MKHELMNTNGKREENNFMHRTACLDWLNIKWKQKGREKRRNKSYVMEEEKEDWMKEEKINWNDEK